jgi:hypothetical protein
MKTIITFALVTAALWCAPAYRRSVTCKKPASTLTDFPVAVKLNDTSFKTSANGGKVQNSSGYDILVRSDTACSTARYWEVESYSASGGTGIVWTKIPSFSSSADEVFYLCYGDSGISTFQSTATSVWNSNAKRIYHMADNAASTTVTDSTAASNSALQANTSGKTTTGQLGSALTFNGSSDYMTPASVSGLELAGATSAKTFTFWLKPGTGTDQFIMGGRNSSNGNPVYNLSLGTNIVNNSGTGKITVLIRDDAGGGLTYFANSGTAINNDAWHYIVWTRSTSKLNTLYQDGSSVASGSDTMGSSVTFNTTGFNWAYEQQNSWTTKFTGPMDEVRVWDTELSADWIAKEYANQSDPASDCTIGAEVSLGGIPSAIIGHPITLAWVDMWVDLPRRRIA